MNIQTTVKYFGKEFEELLETNDVSILTKEEKLLLSDGLNCTFFDDIEEYQSEKENFTKWIENKQLKIKAMLITINERIAIISH